MDAAKAEAADVYSKTEADSLLAEKSDASHTHDGRYYTEDEMDTKLAAKANLASPSLTGTPTALTAASGTNTTQIATTAFVKAGLDGKAASSHNHAAGDITSGILSAARGGTGNTNGTADKLTTARTIRTNLGSTSTASFDGSANVTPGVTGALGTANGGTGNANGTVAKLTTARTIRTNLASTSTASFDGSANITPGVSGTLPVANGGTGNTEGKAATAVKLAQNRRLLTYLANKYDSTSSDSSYNGHWDLSGNTAIPVYGTLGIANGGTGGTDFGWQSLTNSSVFSGTVYYR